MSIQLKDIEWLHTENIKNEIWDYYLGRFTNPYSVSKILNESLTSQTLIKIVNATRQAKDLYHAYHDSERISLPLLFEFPEKLQEVPHKPTSE